MSWFNSVLVLELYLPIKKDENNKRNSDREYSVTVLMYDVSCILMFIYHVILILLIFLFLLVSQLKMQYQIES